VEASHTKRRFTEDNKENEGQTKDSEPLHLLLSFVTFVLFCRGLSHHEEVYRR
jgi:hypothetical protein